MTVGNCIFCSSNIFFSIWTWIKDARLKYCTFNKHGSRNYPLLFVQKGSLDNINEKELCYYGWEHYYLWNAVLNLTAKILVLFYFALPLGFLRYFWMRHIFATQFPEDHISFFRVRSYRRTSSSSFHSLDGHSCFDDKVGCSSELLFVSI
jgi:hypothetical protein